MDRHLFYTKATPDGDLVYKSEIGPSCQWVLDGGVECDLCLGTGDFTPKLGLHKGKKITCDICQGTGRLPLAVSRWYADDGMRVQVKDGLPWAIKKGEPVPLESVPGSREAWNRIYSWNKTDPGHLDGTYSLLTHATTEKGDVCGECGGLGYCLNPVGSGIPDEQLDCSICHGTGILPTLKRWGSEAVQAPALIACAKAGDMTEEVLFPLIKRTLLKKQYKDWSGLAFESGDKRVIVVASMLEAGG